MKGDEMSVTTPSLQVQFSISPTIASIDRPAPEEVEAKRKEKMLHWMETIKQFGAKQCNSPSVQNCE